MRVPRAVPTSFLFLLGLATSSSVLAGQSALRGPTASVLTSTTSGPLRSAVSEERGDSVDRDIRPTHWQEGALVGGLIGAVGGTVLGLAICRNSEELGKNCAGSAVAGGLISAVVLAIPGALIGGLMPKGVPEE
jgi:hypothetical protein